MDSHTCCSGNSVGQLVGYDRLYQNHHFRWLLHDDVVILREQLERINTTCQLRAYHTIVRDLTAMASQPTTTANSQNERPPKALCAHKTICMCNKVVRQGATLSSTLVSACIKQQSADDAWRNSRPSKSSHNLEGRTFRTFFNMVRSCGFPSRIPTNCRQCNPSKACKFEQQCSKLWLPKGLMPKQLTRYTVDVK